MGVVRKFPVPIRGRREIVRLVEPFCRGNTGVFYEDGMIRVRVCGKTIMERESHADSLYGIYDEMIDALFTSIKSGRAREIILDVYSSVYEEHSNNWGE